MWVPCYNLKFKINFIFSSSHVLKKQKATGTFICNNIFYLTQYIQTLFLQGTSISINEVFSILLFILSL